MGVEMIAWLKKVFHVNPQRTQQLVSISQSAVQFVETGEWLFLKDVTTITQ